VLSPSAALDVAGAVNLTLFGARIEQRVNGLPLPDEPVEERGPWLPATLLTDRGAPTPFAMEYACYRTGHHVRSRSGAQGGGGNAVGQPAAAPAGPPS
jgi:hypothetical protein